MFKVLLNSFQCVGTNYTRSVNNQECTMFCIVDYWLKFYTIQDKTAQVLKFLKVSLGQGTQYKICQAFILFFF